MKRRALRALAAVLAVAASALTGVAVAGPARADTAICQKYGSTTIAGGKYVVQNNNWGDDTQQCINVTGTGFTVTQASHNKPQNGAPGSYPSIYAGCHYANCSTGSGLPMRVSDSRFRSVQTSVRMTYPSTGVYDASYDIWFDPTARTDGQNTGAELMVWLNRTGSVQPVGSRVATVSLAGGTWDVWFGNTGWNVVSYVRTTPTSSISFPVSAFYDDMLARGYAQSSWYMTSVQAGFEPWVGGAGLAVNDFSYSVGGSGDGGGGAACKVAYAKQEWPGGFTANVTITNSGGTAVNGWTLAFAFPGDQKITNAWNATVSQSGTSVTARNAAHNASIPAGGTTSFGFQGTWSANDSTPAAYTLNGTTCTTT
ncbi:GH12 family glycosyl hydrolase domain-containing protein [Sphaerisporangium fuscum]|uniref:GH12 family glycosyl hydrolase domain-containing protein n=1 Tax=Sphaerisporangium fuscum TaxID=2835868 RepID=UPI001BDCDFE3|nr:cellulose binding domain-containing protein [Sphaerisporangium fuscum]